MKSDGDMAFTEVLKRKDVVPQEAAHPFDRKTLVLVEDTECDIKLMQRAFELTGIINPIQIVRTGEEAIDYLSKQQPPPTALLLDLNLPGKNGFDVLAWIRSQPGLRRMIVIVLTSSNNHVDADRAYELGANFYVTKPVVFHELVKMTHCLRSWLKLNHFPRDDGAPMKTTTVEAV